jgi:hypothetical protein
MGLPKENTSEIYAGEPIICLECTRAKYKPGTLIETDFSMLDEPNELKKFNGIKGIIVRPLGCHEDLAGCLDYVVSWDWKDDRLYEFLKIYKGSNRELLDPRITMEFIKEVKD